MTNITSYLVLSAFIALIITLTVMVYINQHTLDDQLKFMFENNHDLWVKLKRPMGYAWKPPKGEIVSRYESVSSRNMLFFIYFFSMKRTFVSFNSGNELVRNRVILEINSWV
jgi:hypothetical protein